MKSVKNRLRLLHETVLLTPGSNYTYRLIQDPVKVTGNGLHQEELRSPSAKRKISHDRSGRINSVQVPARFGSTVTVELRGSGSRRPTFLRCLPLVDQIAISGSAKGHVPPAGVCNSFFFMGLTFADKVYTKPLRNLTAPGPTLSSNTLVGMFHEGGCDGRTGKEEADAGI